MADLQVMETVNTIIKETIITKENKEDLYTIKVHHIIREAPDITKDLMDIIKEIQVIKDHKIATVDMVINKMSEITHFHFDIKEVCSFSK